jgi:hypothetical protein
VGKDDWPAESDLNSRGQWGKVTRQLRVIGTAGAVGKGDWPA